MRSTRRLRPLLVVAALAALGPSTPVSGQGQQVDPGPTPKATCGPGSNAETGRQGRVSAADHTSGRAAKGYTCNMQLVGRFGGSGGYKVERYADAAGNECAYYDTTLLFPSDAPGAGTNLTGVYVLDMADPAKPVRTETLVTPAMQSPHESVLLNDRRGLLAAVMGNPAFYPGVVDVYDVSQDCRHPVLKSTSPTGILGHESGFAPDGRTFYASSLVTGHVTAVDVSNPSAPVPLWTGRYSSHGLSISDDGNRAYLAVRDGAGPSGDAGLIILDVSQIQSRVANPQARVVSSLTWDNVSVPQIAIPVKIGGHPYVVEMDEFSSSANSPGSAYDPASKVGAARMIDIADETKPRVISNIRLEVHSPENRASQAGDPEATNSLRGYAGHYCAVPKRDDPGVVACTFILSGLRLFDIRDPHHPKEIAYFNPPGTSYAMSSPSFVPERREIWYSDGDSGFYAVRVTNGVWSFAQAAAPPAPAPTPPPAPAPVAEPATLPATGVAVPAGAGLLLLFLAVGIRRVTRGRPRSRLP